MRPPKNITYHSGRKVLALEFADEAFELTAELLRVYSPSAEVRGHSESERRLQTGKKQVAITNIEAVGNYAVRLSFDDGHDTGIYAWELLFDLGKNQTEYWERYLTELKAANASRLPTIPVSTFTPPRKPG